MVFLNTPIWHAVMPTAFASAVSDSSAAASSAASAASSSAASSAAASSAAASSAAYSPPSPALAGEKRPERGGTRHYVERTIENARG